MSKYKEYEKIKTKIKEIGGSLSPYQEINYGIQFDVNLGALTSKVRIYESKKKGITIDLSQVKHQSIKIALGESGQVAAEDNPNNPYESDKIMVPLIGVDESGKGDYFGPLVIAAVYADYEQKKQLIALGVADSKKLSDLQIGKMAVVIKEICPYEVIVIDNYSYNRLYHKIQNLNLLLAKGHAKVIETLEQKTGAKLALSDQFGNEKLIETELKRYNTCIKLEQRPKAESNVVVAAASILARDAFVREMSKLGVQYGQEFPKGAGDSTVRAAKRFVEVFGKQELLKVAKTHFKTTEQL